MVIRDMKDHSAEETQAMSKYIQGTWGAQNTPL